MCAHQFAQVAHGGHALARKLGEGLRSGVLEESTKIKLAHGRRRGRELRAQHVHVRRRGEQGLVEPARARRVRVSSVLPHGVRWTLDTNARLGGRARKRAAPLAGLGGVTVTKQCFMYVDYHI